MQRPFEKLSGRGRWLALGFGLSIAAGCLSRGPSSSRRELDVAEMEQVRGGIAADISFPANNSTQTFDNLRFTASITGASGDATIAVFADATKAGAQIVTIPDTWDGRTSWPMPGLKTAQFKFASGGDFFDVEGDSMRTNVGLNPGVNVYGIRARNLDTGFISTTGLASFLRERLDAIAAAAPTKTSNSLDGIWGDCGGADKTQWRLLDTVTMPASGNCADLAAVAASCGPPFDCDLKNWSDCPALVHCLNTVYAPEAAKTHDAYVFHTESVMCGAVAVSFPFEPSGQDMRTMVLMSAGSTADPITYTTILAHELGHEFSFGHCNDGNPLTTKCTASDCAVSGPPRNLMCSSGQGRTLNAAQCTGYAAGLRWTDRND